MIIETLIVLVSGVLLGTASLVLSTIIRSRLALWRFQRKSPKMPILENAALVGNHVASIYLTKNATNRIIEWHKKYGKTFAWIFGAHPAVSSIDLDLLKTILIDEPQSHINRMPFNSTRGEFEVNNIFTARDEQWRRIRRAFSPALKPAKFKTLNVAREIQNSIDKLLDAIENKLASASAQGESSIELNADDIIHRYQMNLIFSCFYKQTNLIDFNAEHDHWIETVEKSLGSVITHPIVRLCMTFPIFRPLADWIMINFHRAGAWRRDLMRFVKLQTKTGVEARKQLAELRASAQFEQAKDPSTAASSSAALDEDNFMLKDGTQYSRNMIDHVIDHFLAGKLSKEEYFNSSAFLFAAADKTAADAITHTIFQLAQHQDIQDKLRESLKADGIESQYLGLVLNEALRLFPPVSIGSSRIVTRDMELADGKVVPAGTYVLTPVYIIHRLKEYWGDDAEEFKPDRFLDTSKHHPMQYFPFGVGVRMCPGKDFAVHEIKLMLSAILLRYKFELSRPKKDTGIFDSPLFIYTVPNSPTYIRLTRVDL